MSSRLEKLHEFYNEDPNDPFNLYALALEYTSADKIKAEQYFSKLIAEHESYIATYYHAAQLYIDLKENSKAEATFKKGIEIAQKNQDNHALRELQSAYQNFLFENE